MPGPSPVASFEDLCAICERLYKRDGFVVWSEVATEIGVTRQAVYNRLKKAIDSGRLSQNTMDRWESMSARRAQARYKRDLYHKADLKIQLTEENALWLDEVCKARVVSRADVINGLCNLARVRN